MADKFSAVSDSGPIIHLSEIDATKAFNIFKELVIPDEVSREIRNLRIPSIRIIQLDQKHKDITKFLAVSYNLDLGEAEAISLCMQENIKILFTDDLEARTIAKHYKLEVHGTIGILVKSFRAGIFAEKEVTSKLELLRTKSSLFLTKDLLDWSIKQIKEYSRRKR
ncbi:hypothetical protein HYW20_07615 [Candidatus Woesearchaeota archaeon]|nr:hypothetical protein [Candidatus Woesearchaeota archaeon]